MRQDPRPNETFPDIELPNQDKEVVRLNARLPDCRGILPRLLLTKGPSPVGELRRAPSTRAIGELLQARGHFG